MELVDFLVKQSRGSAEETYILRGIVSKYNNQTYAKIDGNHDLWGPIVGGDELDDGVEVVLALDQNNIPYVVYPAAGGDGSGGMNLIGTWRWTTSVGAPSARDVGINTSAWNTATMLNISETSEPGADASNVLSSLQPNDTIYLQDKSDATRWAKYKITLPATDFGT